jgi:hypothetical protein
MIAMRYKSRQVKMVFCSVSVIALGLLCAFGCEQGSNLFTGVPNLLQPLNGQVLTTTSPYFDWTDVVSATRYHLRVTSGQNGLVVIERDNLVTSEYYAVEILTPGDYNWQVQAGDANNWGSWSVQWTFTIQQSSSLPK